MHADGREQFGIGRGQHHRHRTPGGDAGDVDPFGIDAPAGGLLDHLADDPGEDGRLTLRAELVPGAEPVPASLAVVRHRLFRIDDDELVLVGQIVEPGTGGEVKAVLPAAVQRQEHRRLGGPAQADRDVHPVGPGAGHPGESRLTPAALAGRGQRRSRRSAAGWFSSGGLAGRRLGPGWRGFGSGWGRRWLAVALGLVGAVAFGRPTLVAVTFGVTTFGVATFAAARVAARTVLVAALVAALGRRARFFRAGFGRNALISAEGNRDLRARATNAVPGQETSSSPIRDQSSPGITKFTIRGVSTMAGSSVFMAWTK